jgi:putative oxidoreductase
MGFLMNFVCKISNLLTGVFDFSAHFVALGIRAYLCKIFFWSGWLKLTAWSSTLYLFEHEYKIVGMSPVMAAYLGTAAEIALPVFLILGLGARIPAVALFVFNIFNVIYYPVLLKPEFALALKDNVIWGILIAVLVLYGNGKISLDYWLQKKVCKEYQY